MRLLFSSRRLTIVKGLPSYADQWRDGGKLPFFAIRKAPKGGGVHILLRGFCLGIKLT
ncbi:hypothetical protein ACELLULO517_00515 [Acidisoma cellulosilytica]|uniref:Uncharacterized protein n=1 Tax=Acidisoma cellulosilyticum TaxID=2802395 RepID=A0A963YYK3_9PROT|nr:hypothetical protein [Acidisoma cellulosilyticum]MCB8878697.1 hypothetical protein [Acidisoma cellulosilyticum]